MTIVCNCGQDSVYVDNVPGKEYHYCRSCKKEVHAGSIYSLRDEQELLAQGLDALLKQTLQPRILPIIQPHYVSDFMINHIDYRRGEVRLLDLKTNSLYVFSFLAFHTETCMNPHLASVGHIFMNRYLPSIKRPQTTPAPPSGGVTGPPPQPPQPSTTSQTPQPHPGSSHGSGTAVALTEQVNWTQDCMQRKLVQRVGYQSQEPLPVFGPKSRTGTNHIEAIRRLLLEKLNDPELSQDLYAHNRWSKYLQDLCKP